MKITVLVENTSSRDGIGAEHGLSLHIEAKSKKILFDAGQSDLVLRNAEALGIDLSDVDVCILSHGHYDHGGGISAFLEVNKKAPVYINPHAFGERYNADGKYIGLDPALESSDRLMSVGDGFEIGEGLTLYSENIDRHFDLGSFGLTAVYDGIHQPDDFRHEQYLMIEENGRRVLISGCSHRGILNIMKHFSPDALVGGFHFSKMPLDGTLSEYAEYLDSFDAEYYTCHCTGDRQYTFMKQYMNRLHYAAAGDIFRIGEE